MRLSEENNRGVLLTNSLVFEMKADCSETQQNHAFVLNIPLRKSRFSKYELAVRLLGI